MMDENVTAPLDPQLELDTHPLPISDSYNINSKKNIVFFIITLFSISILVSIYALARGQKFVTQPSKDQSTIAKQPIVNQEKNAGDWRLYEGGDSSFTFLYPPNLILDKFESPYEINILKTVNYNSNAAPSGQQSGDYQILIYEPEISPTPEEFVTSGIKSSEYQRIGGYEYNKVGEKNITNSELNKISIVTKISNWSSTEKQIYLYQDGKGVLLQMMGDTGDNGKIENLILTTFKFLNDSSSNSNVKKFSSSNLGISFEYQEKVTGSDETFATKEIGNKVYVYSNIMQPTQGQYVEVFEKKSSDDLVSAVTNKILDGYSTKDCIVRETGKNLSSTLVTIPKPYVIAQIGLPSDINYTDPESILPYLAKCPAEYTSANGLSYFLMDPKYPNKFVFFSIGQYAIMANNEQSWQDTINFTN